MRFLISNAGVAGLSTAVNLGADGPDVPPIDIRGDALDMADKVGLLGQIRERRIGDWRTGPRMKGFASGRPARGHLRAAASADLARVNISANGISEGGCPWKT